MLKLDEPVKRLGDYKVEKILFPGIERVIERLVSESAGRHEIHEALFDQIEVSPHESFLLSAVVDFIARIVNRLDSGYSLLSFERWLDQKGEISEEQRLLIRAKIVGRYIPREEYQSYFPIGLGRTHRGTHIVTAHNPPDLDTAVASFWGWIDAFAARVSELGHQWNLPGEEVTGQIRRLFEEIVGGDLISLIPRRSASLSVTASDLVTTEGVELHREEVLTTSLDHRGLERCIILVDEEGSFLGTWRSCDVEGFRTLVLLLTDCWRWFSSSFYDKIVTLFAQPVVSQGEVKQLLLSLFETRLQACGPVEDVSEEQAGRLDGALRCVLGVERGLEATFAEFAKITEFSGLRSSMERLADADLYGPDGELIADRTALFGRVQGIVREVQAAMQLFRAHIDRLGTAMEVKREIFHHARQYVTPLADLDEIRVAIGPHHFLPVVEPRGEKLLPIGVISASSLREERLCTVSLRDFCNRDEVKIASHFETISVVDHHRASLETASFPTVVLGDVQSCNTLLAELSMAINDRYSVGGGGHAERVEETLSGARIRQKELQREIAARSRGDWFVHPRREMAEYLSYLYAILDDTDLLSRVTTRDVVVVASLLNRMVSLMEGREVEVVHFDDLPRDSSFPAAAAQRILQNEQMYSLYSRIYAVREQEVVDQFVACVEGRGSSLFTDTKEQKGCARVGQIKLFPNNFSTYGDHRSQLRQHWLEKAKEVHRHRPELQLHIQMVSTIAGAEEVYRGEGRSYTHQDEIWVWVAPTEGGYSRLASFLTGFKGGVSGMQHVELHGDEDGQLHEIFGRHFEKRQAGEGELGIAVVKCDAGVITSRKSHITPYLPAN